MKPHYAISYQLKEVTNTDTPEFKNWFKDSKVVDEGRESFSCISWYTSRWIYRV